jgi:hypothetical protein
VRVDGQLVFKAPYQMLHAAKAGLGLACVLEDMVHVDVAGGRRPRSACWSTRCASNVNLSGEHPR